MAYKVGQSVSGVVSGVTEYGAFVRLDDGSTGMIHISKLSRDFVSDIHSVIKRGDKVEATVISTENGRIALSLIGEIAEKRERPEVYEPRKPRESNDFESMLSSFKTISDEKLSGLSRDKKRRR